MSGPGEQLSLHGHAPARALTERQAWGLAYLNARRDGVTPADLGEAWLERQGRPAAYVQAWAHDTGRGLLVALRRKGLAVQRRGRGSRWFAIGHEVASVVGPGDLEGF